MAIIVLLFKLSIILQQIQQQPQRIPHICIFFYCNNILRILVHNNLYLNIQIPYNFLKNVRVFIQEVPQKIFFHGQNVFADVCPFTMRAFSGCDLIQWCMLRDKAILWPF